MRAPWRHRAEHGQTSLLIAGFFVVAVLMVVVVVDASAAYLRRQALDSVADGAALAAADGVQGERVYQGGLAERAEIDPAAARRYVAAYLAAVGAHTRYPGLGYQVHASTDAVAVRITAPLDLPFTPPGWQGRTTVTGTAASYVVVTD